MKAIQMEEATSYRNVDGAQYENARTHTHTHTAFMVREIIVKESSESDMKNSRNTPRSSTQTHTHISRLHRNGTQAKRVVILYFFYPRLCVQRHLVLHAAHTNTKL